MGAKRGGGEGKEGKGEGTETAWRQNEPILGLLRSFSTLSPRH